MMKRMFVFMISLVIACGISISAQGAFIDRGGGLIYDTDLDRTWLQDANYAMTSGYDADGLMNWHDANAWAASLNIRGYTGFRLPTFNPSDPRPSTASSDNELPSLLMTFINGDWDSYSSYDVGPFINLPYREGYGNSVYWTGLSYDADRAWEYHMDCG